MPSHPSLLPLPTILLNKKGKGKQRVSKQTLLKGCHQGQNIAVSAILERFLNFSCRPTMVGRQHFSVFHGLSTLKYI